MIEVPNLDCLDRDELRQFLRSGGVDAVPEGVNFNLRRYASVKMSAMQCRVAGLIESASKLERECDRIYRRIPNVYRW